MPRCAWARTELSIAYHDREWGVPQHDDRVLLEFLLLEGAQAGLSWETILRKREAYRQSFDGFDPERVAGYGEEKIAALLADPRIGRSSTSCARGTRSSVSIVRNRLKVRSAVSNARAFLAVQEEFGSFDSYLWGFVNGTPLQNAWRSLAEIPAQTEASRALSTDLKRRGFRFVGPTICYALMQAVGLVNDHTTNCPRWSELGG